VSRTTPASVAAAYAAEAADICREVEKSIEHRSDDFARGVAFGARECASRILGDGLRDVEPTPPLTPDIK
jgi:hypothetical protein